MSCNPRPWRALREFHHGLLGLVVVFFAGSSAGASDVTTAEVEGLHLTVPVQETLLRLQDQWLVLSSAFLQNDRVLAWASVRDLRSTAADMGLENLPELGLGMLVRAVEAARGGDTERAEWALEMAHELDPVSPSWSFGASRVAWIRHKYPTALRHLATGYVGVVGTSLGSRLWLANMVLWLTLTLVTTGAAYVALQMITKGPQLLRDLISYLGAWVPTAIAGAVAVAVLTWPLLLPSGWVWLVLLWAVLLWGYGSSSERWAMAGAIVILCLAPIVINRQQHGLELALRPESRVLDNLSQNVLYGELFHDLGALRETLPNSTALQHLVADLHVRLGQDDLARPIYREIIKREPNNGTVLNNLGTYHLLRGEQVRAIEFLQQAAGRNESALAANYNLGKAYLELLEWQNQDRYLAAARDLDNEQVRNWVEEGLPAVTLSGGFDRIEEIRSQLVAVDRARRAEHSPWTVWMGLAAGVLASAWLVHRLGRTRLSAPSLASSTRGRALERWLRWLVPGVTSSEAGDGGRAFAALLVPVGALILPLSGALGYAVPWGFDPGVVLSWTLSLLLLATFFSVRWANR